ncbi:MAG TPA: thiamine phosphate synthase [Longimicrobiaceae bacterium]|nr:thiamine phosphate synthase [Longimicrobiaceae bacterium]
MANGSAERSAVIPRLHIVTDDDVLASRGFPETARRIVELFGPTVALHLRGPTMQGRALFTIADRLAPLARDAGTILLVNDRVDIALAVGAHGVQLGVRGLSITDARRLLGDSAWIGTSVHSEDEADQAARAGADFLVAGTVFPSRSHPERAGAGTSWLRRLADMRIPVIGIGGITVARVPEIIAAGAHGAAVMSGVWRASDPIAAVGDYLQHLSINS